MCKVRSTHQALAPMDGYQVKLIWTLKVIKPVRKTNSSTLQSAVILLELILLLVLSV